MEWGTVPAWLTFVVASTASAMAVRQLRLAQEVKVNQVELARANLILTIDKEFESEAIKSSRSEIRLLRNKVTNQLSKGKKQSAQSRERIAEMFSDHLNQLYQTLEDNGKEGSTSQPEVIAAAAREYTNLMALPYFFETVGLLCKNNLVLLEDVVELYDQAIVGTIANFEGHFRTRQEDPYYPNPFFMESTLWLLDRGKEHQDRVAPKPLKPAPKGGGVRWTARSGKAA